MQMAAFLLCPHMVKRECSGVPFSSYKGTVPIGLGLQFYDLI